ncbi:MAG: hypothetical protein HFI29_14210 [Lachnospiraceae bacterium]|nr:hypothetical protein [Lachnospiraceae bacterium]
MKSEKEKEHLFFRATLFLLLLGLLIHIADYGLYNDSTYTRLTFHEMYQAKQIDITFIGSSIVQRHFEPEIWSECLEMEAFNLGTPLQTPDDAYYIMKELFKNQSPRYCIYGVNWILFHDMDIYNNPTKSYIVFDYLKPSLDKCVYGYIAFRDKSLLNAWLPATRNTNEDLIRTVNNVLEVKKTEAYQSYGNEIYKTLEDEYTGRGFLYSYKQIEKGTFGKPEGYSFRDYSVSQTYISYMNKLKALCEANDCELIFIVPPLPYASMVWQEDYQEIVDFYVDIANDLDVTIFHFDLSKPEYLFMEDTDFYDYGHMSGKGAEKFSRAASELIKKYIDGEEIDQDEYFYSSYEELLDNSPWIFNAWLEKTEDGYQAYSTYGNNVNPEYCFQWSGDRGESWHMLQVYSEKNQIAGDKIPDGCDMLMVWARPEGEVAENADYQQCDRMELK